jgi:hypothetical protein
LPTVVPLRGIVPTTNFHGAVASQDVPAQLRWLDEERSSSRLIF